MAGFLVSDMTHMVHGSSSAGRPWYVRLLLPAVGIMLLTALMGAALLRQGEPRTVSQVRDEIHRIVLHRSEKESFDDGGSIGPWHVAAHSFDEVAGDFHDFRLRSGSINLGAARARLVIEADRNTFSFKLRDVVIARVPGARETDASHHLIPLDTFELGPVPYERPIIPD